MTLEFRSGRATDADILSHLRECDASFSSALSARVDLTSYAEKIRKHAVTFEAWDGTRLVGLVAAYFNDKQSAIGFITSVSIVPDWVGRGVARVLMASALDYARTNQFFRVNLQVEEGNYVALSLYRKMGFENQNCEDGLVNMTWVRPKK
ncbi:GNAT family N-acetyltransferase [Geothrix campi]|uniref:GNAT family N-acetyltransferase n=1 Tax=Geothrix campi TaxID=2966450 RepID=UPI0021486A2A|nr:GNAT family N-acetyltransferase [Geothrix sp. SG10]